MLSSTTALGLQVLRSDRLNEELEVPAALRQRKGWLLLVSRSEADIDCLAAAHHHFYRSLRFDIEPLLLESISVASGIGEHGVQRWSCCGAVLSGLDATALLPDGFGLWVYSDGKVRPVPSWPVPSPISAKAEALRRSHHRIRPGEVLVLGSTELETIWKRHPARVRRFLRRAPGQARTTGRPPLALVSYPRGAPVALEQPWKSPPVLLPPREAATRASAISPVWIAVLVAFLSLIGVYAVKRPSLPEATWSETITFLLTVDRWGQASDGDTERPPLLQSQ